MRRMRMRAVPVELPFFDARVRDGYGPQPLWTPDSHKPWKPGQSRGAWIWPRDKRLRSTPLGSKRRWADVLTGKGPGIFVGDRRRFGPTRNTWSNWAGQPRIFDSLGYRNEDPDHRWIPGQDAWRKYDFRKRRYTNAWHSPDVWSDVKWGRDRDIPLMFRDGWAQEWNFGKGYVLPHDSSLWGNDFRHRFYTPQWDWARPAPRWFWDPFLHA